MYFFHRYQTEAAAKIIGGLNYRYALRGDGQPITEMVTADAQQKALDALLQTVSVQNLTIPDKIVSLLAPRPLGYDPHRELITGRTDLTFDPLSAAETAADMAFRLLLHPARVNRLLEQNARNPQQPSLTFILKKVTLYVYNQKIDNTYEQAVGQTIAQTYLNQLIRLAISNEVSAQAKAEILAELSGIQNSLLGTQPLPMFSKAMRNYQAAIIQTLKTNPDELKLPSVPNPPPGQPIGTTEDWCSVINKE
jgi:hypothetical protein